MSDHADNGASREDQLSWMRIIAATVEEVVLADNDAIVVLVKGPQRAELPYPPELAAALCPGLKVTATIDVAGTVAIKALPRGQQ